VSGAYRRDRGDPPRRTPRFNLIGGDDGVFFTKWGTIDGTPIDASATGNGSIRVVAANAAGDNLFVNGYVSAVNTAPCCKYDGCLQS
jgi:hypothetical protein